jgi:signal transduction histidine kinase
VKLRLPKTVWAAVAIVFAYALVCLLVPRGLVLTAAGDLVPFFLLSVATIVMLRHAAASRGQERAFWALLSLGCFLWAANQGMWVWYEVILRQDMPEPFLGDPVLFLHVVPFMVAVALLPHLAMEARKLYFSTLSSLILVLWWIYLYAFIVFPDEYVLLNQHRYNHSFDQLFMLENMLLVAAAGLAAMGTRGSWRRIYAHLCGAAFLYSLTSWGINLAISAGSYYTGSIYDIFLVASLAWFVCLGSLRFRTTPEPEEAGRLMRFWIAASPRLAMLAVLSLPLFGLRTFLETDPPPLRRFRLILTLVAVVVMGACVFLKQYLLDRELLRLLQEKEKDYERLQRLQSELLQKEKLAAVGQLAAGAAHEINNPLTAILGYSEILANAGLRDDLAAMAVRIGQQARRTRTLVGDLLSFAQHDPGERSLLEVGTLVQKAAQMETHRVADHSVLIETTIEDGLPRVWGNANQLLQLCLQILENASYAVREAGGGGIQVRVSRRERAIAITFADTGPGLREPARVFDPFYTTKPVGKGTGLGLSAVYGIVQNHHGAISCRNREEGGAEFEVLLPLATDSAQAAAAGYLPTAAR